MSKSSVSLLTKWPFEDIQDLPQVLRQVSPVRHLGRVLSAVGPRVIAELHGVSLGDFVRIYLDESRVEFVLAQVVGFEKEKAILSTFDTKTPLSSFAEVELIGKRMLEELTPRVLGSVVNSFGQVLRSSTSSAALQEIPPGLNTPTPSPPSPLERQQIKHQFHTGIPLIDCFIPLGEGQRMSIFAEPGVGKSTLLQSIARNSSADVVVIGLIGERGREVSEFVSSLEGSEAQQRTTVVISTSDEAAPSRILAANTATRIAEYFRDAGLSVLLLMDSLTRLFRAYREVGLAAGEIPVRQGYPPSVFAELPVLIERAGPGRVGSITALYTVLTSGEFGVDPMAEELKGLTDGHIALKRELAEQGLYPAIDILSSLSRLESRFQTKKEQQQIGKIRHLLSRAIRERDIVLLGGNPDQELTAALALEKKFQEMFYSNTSQNLDLESLLGELDVF